jgi:hypothetical protein
MPSLEPDSISGSRLKTASTESGWPIKYPAMHGSSIRSKPPLPRLYHGWLVVATAFLVALFGFGLGFYGPGIYLVALNELYGWPVVGEPNLICT